jgi:xylitol oxidase
MSAAAGPALRNWAGNVTFSTTTLRRPASVAALQELVASSRKVRALGTGHSFTPVADTTGVLVSVAGLPQQVFVDAAAGTARVPAGARYGDIAATVHAQGWALPNLGSLPHIGVAGACATGTHGSGNANGGLATAVRAVQFVRADGELVTVSAVQDPDRFGGVVVALGALGVVTELTLAIEPTYQVRQDVWLDPPLPTVLASLDEIMSAGYSVSLFTDWGRPDVVDAVWVKTRLAAERGAGAEPPDVADGRHWGARAADTGQHPIRSADPAAATAQLGEPGPWLERLPHFRLTALPSVGAELQSEFLVAREHAAEALDALRGLAGRLHPVVLTCEYRTVAADELWLSPSHGRDSFALHFTWRPDIDAVRPVLAAVESALEPCEPRPHWGKIFTMSPEHVAAQYPRLPEFRTLMDDCDPDRVFGNAFVDTYVRAT